ncbi:SpoIIE family protein phosphatase OS=Streptomyces cyaneofuscatus OX=66883 GN=G3I52_16800 PE=4 SV=1 [Streptomyces cyaneofuscatus]
MGGAVSYAETPAGSGTPPGGLDDALLKTLFTQSAVGLLVLDPQLRLVRANSLVEGVGTEEYIGLRFTEAFRLDDPDGSEQLLKAVLAGEGPVREHLVRGRLRRIPGDRIFLVSAYRLDGPGGPDAPALGLLSAVVDVTERERRARETALAAVRDAVGGSLDVATTCRAFIDALVPGFADLAVIEVVDEVLRGADPPVGPLPPDTPLRCAARGRCDTVRGDEPGRIRPVGGTRRLPPRTPYALAVADLRPRLVPLTADTPGSTPTPEGVHRLAETGAHSLIVVPLTLRGAVLGLVSLYRCGAAEPFDEEDVSLAGTAATRAALAIDNARRYEREHVIASTVQRRLLPQAERHQAAVETAHVLLPAGTAAAGLVSMGSPGPVRHSSSAGSRGRGSSRRSPWASSVPSSRHSPASTWSRRRYWPDSRRPPTASPTSARPCPRATSLHGEELRAGCVYGVYDPFTRTCTVARAGHPAPLIVGPDGHPLSVDPPRGPGPLRHRRRLLHPPPSPWRRAASSRSARPNCSPTSTPRTASRGPWPAPAAACSNWATTSCTPSPTTPGPPGRRCSWPVRVRSPTTGSPPGTSPRNAPPPPPRACSCATSSGCGPGRAPSTRPS